MLVLLLTMPKFNSFFFLSACYSLSEFTVMAKNKNKINKPELLVGPNWRQSCLMRAHSFKLA